jgi:dienelactone hydrolase
MVCETFSSKGYDIICPNLTQLPEPFEYNYEKEAYAHFMNNIGFDSAVQSVKRVIAQAKNQYKYTYLLGYSIGATIAWLCSEEENICNGIIGYYGSRIRDYINVTPKCPILFIFPDYESSFNVKELVCTLKKYNENIFMVNGKHGFADPFSKAYYLNSHDEAEKLVIDFLKYNR